MGNHDIFICFSSKDEAIARDVVQFLEGRGLKCWISLRDVPAGQNYQETIVQALEEARAIVFLFSPFSSQSDEIKKELSLGGGFRVPVFPLRLSPIIPAGALRYELATRQWIDIFPDANRALDKLADTIDRALNPSAAADSAPAVESSQTGSDPIAPVQMKPRPARKRVKKVREPIVAANSPEFEAVRMLLARHVGPIAKIFVQKAATDARSIDDLCEQLAAHVPTAADRAAFMQAARARLSSVKS